MATHDNWLNPLKGFTSTSNNLTYTAKQSPDVNFTLVAGRVCQQNSAGDLVPGCVGWAMPLWALNSADDPDARNTAVAGEYYGANGGDKLINCLVGSGGYEVATTEFDRAQTYVRNQPLRAPSGLSASTTAGVLTNQGVVATASGSPANATNVVAIVSSGTQPNPYTRALNGKTFLHCWTVWHPGNASET